MEGMDWNESHSVGIDSIDNQHKELVRITNKLFDAIIADKGRSIVFDVLDELVKYVDYHFNYEEELLIKHGYPEDHFKMHIDEHQALTNQVNSFINEVKDADMLDLEVFDFLRIWTTDHLDDTDRKYSDFLRSKGVE